jgi:hypothetical protein
VGLKREGTRAANTCLYAPTETFFVFVVVDDVGLTVTHDTVKNADFYGVMGNVHRLAVLQSSIF